MLFPRGQPVLAAALEDRIAFADALREHVVDARSVATDAADADAADADATVATASAEVDIGNDPAADATSVGSSATTAVAAKARSAAAAAAAAAASPPTASPSTSPIPKRLRASRFAAARSSFASALADGKGGLFGGGRGGASPPPLHGSCRPAI